MPDKQDKVTGKNNDPESNSGYTEDLDKETNGSESSPIENTYSNLQEYYVSQSGHSTFHCHQIWQTLRLEMPQEGLSLHTSLSTSPHQGI